MLQLLYLRFLCTKRAVYSWFPKFAAYFRAAIPEVRGKTEISRPDPGFALPRPAVLLPKIGFCLEVSDFPRTFGKHGNAERPEAKTATNSAGKTIY